jgi:hypothetical protein
VTATTRPVPALPLRERMLTSLTMAVAIAAVFATVATGVHWNTVAVGGSDSHCYAEQARMLMRGQFALDPLLQMPVPWPNAAATFAPSGFAPGPGPTGASVPLCPAGLSIVMGVAYKLGGLAGLFMVVPWMGALCVWSTFLIGRKIGGPAVGAGAAVLMAASPTFLYQLVQPMSDVPAAALWTASLAAALVLTGERERGALLSGVLAGAAVMMRPNLAPLAVFPVALLWPARRQVVAAVGGIIPGVAAVAGLQWLMYGSPLRSGYGDLNALFSLSHVPANLLRYPAWLATAHTPLLALGLAAPLVSREHRRTLVVLVVFACAVLAAYLPYVVFTEWWYSRFVLPGLPVLMIGVMVVAQWAVKRLPEFARVAVVLVVAAGVGAFWSSRAQDLDVFKLKALERKYVELGKYASRTLPANAVVLAAQSTGAVRFYAEMPTLSWDAIDPAWLDRTLDELRRRGYAPFLAVESWEAESFRAHFRGHSPLGGLDWPARATIGRVISVYDPMDHERYLAGENVPSERISWPVR